MKIHVFVIVLATLGAFPSMAFAQKVRIGFMAGPNLTFAKYDHNFPGPDTVPGGDDDFIYVRKAKPGFKYSLGVILDYDISDDLFLTGGVNFLGTHHSTTITQQVVKSGATVDEHKDYNVFAFQMPITLNYRLGQFTAGAGLYGAWAFAGRLKFQGGNRKLAFGNIEANVWGGVNTTSADFQPFDAGMRANLGYGLKRWRITINYDLGLVRIAHKIEFTNNDPLKYNIRKRTLGLSFIYQPWPR